MDREELNNNISCYVWEHVLDVDERAKGVNIKELVKDYEAISKAELEVGKEYDGYCRNAYKATWDGKVFWYERYKFGFTYDENINHYEDDDGYDVFVPIRKKKKCVYTK